MYLFLSIIGVEVPEWKTCPLYLRVEDLYLVDKSRRLEVPEHRTTKLLT